MKAAQVKLVEYGEKAEMQAFDFTKRVILRLLNGFFLFKKRKGEVVAGASTFFTLLCFGPLLLLFISSLSFIFDDPSLAKEFVINGVTLSFPKIDPWILGNVESLIESQLSPDRNNLLQWVFLAFSCMGVSATFVFGINTISKVDPDGGLIRDDLKSAVIGVFVAIFLVILVLMSQRAMIIDYLEDKGLDHSFLISFIESNAFPCLLSLLFFTLFYKWSASIKVSFKDAFSGSLTFLMCFLVGKSGYWLYLKFFKDELIHDYGHFHNFMVIFIWIYFLMCSFFYGASVAYVSNKKILKFKKGRK